MADDPDGANMPVPNRLVSLGVATATATATATAKLTTVIGKEAMPAASGLKPLTVLRVLGDGEPEAHHGAEEKDPSGVAADPFGAGEQPQRHDRLSGARLVDHEPGQQRHRERVGGDGDGVGRGEPADDIQQPRTRVVSGR